VLKHSQNIMFQNIMSRPPTARSLSRLRPEIWAPLCRSPSRWLHRSQRIPCRCLMTVRLQIPHRQVPLFSLPTGLVRETRTMLGQLNSNSTTYSVTHQGIQTALSVTAITRFSYGGSRASMLYTPLTILKVRLHLHGPTFLGYVWSHTKEYHLDGRGL